VKTEELRLLTASAAVRQSICWWKGDVMMEGESDTQVDPIINEASETERGKQIKYKTCP
jgi:hypothetical protein